MTEIKKAGGKEFVFVLIWAVAICTVTAYMKFCMQSYKLVADITAIVLFAILAYFTLVRYSAVYTYYADKSVIRVNRAIGKHRNKEAEFEIKDIKNISRQKPDVRAQYFCISVFSRRQRVYITSRSDKNKAVAIDASPEFYKRARKYAGLD